jgi:ABC-type Fe3+ transport system substrate-binding protein
MTGQAIAAKAPHLNAAKLFQEYSFTEEGYTIWQKLGGAPARKGIKDQRPVAAQPWYKVPTSFIPYDPADAATSMNSVLDDYRKYIGNAR